MFFKMLKSDLKHNRGLNVILFLFSIIAAAFVFTGAAQVYTNFTQNKRTAEYCNTSDVMVNYTSLGQAGMRETHESVEKNLNALDIVSDFVTNESLELDRTMIDLADYDESDSDELSYNELYLTTRYKEKNLVFDSDDKLACPMNGTITVPVNIAKEAGCSIGDKVRITTPLDTIYEFEICSITKEPLCESGSLERFLISEADYEVIAKDFPVKTLTYSIDFKDPDNPENIAKLIDDMKTNSYRGSLCPTKLQGFTDSVVLMYVLSVFLVIISIFMILIIFMTIRFTIIAALKNEEKEIGVMRAMGVDSLGFRWMFAAKYIFFAIFGGVIGILAGIPLSNMLMQMFSGNYISPERSVMAMIGVIAVAANTLLIIFFSVRVMKRINKISVIDAIHGENRGERFGKGSVIKLSKRRRMSVPSFLALSDILSRVKRYIFLVVAYVLGFLIMLMIFNIKNSVISPEFMKYMNTYEMDFSIEFKDDDKYEEITRRVEAENSDHMKVINEIMAENDIQAEVDYGNFISGELQLGNDKTRSVYMIYGAKRPERLNYRKGSRVPELDNEIVLSYYSANKAGINIGDTLKISVPVWNDDKITFTSQEREYVVTGFTDILEGGGMQAYVGGVHDDLYSYGQYIFAMRYTDDNKDPAGTFQKLEEVFGERNVMTGEEYIVDALRDYSSLFTLLEIVMGGAVILISVLITYLYQNIFIAEETSEIALMKSMGYTDGSVKRWQITRMLILSLFSVLLAQVLFRTLGVILVNKFFGVLELSGFGFLLELPVTFAVLPAVFIGAIMLTVMLTTHKVKDIAVWNISNE